MGCRRVPFCGRQHLSVGTQEGQEPHGVGRPRACTETPRTTTGRSQVFSIISSGRLMERTGEVVSREPPGVLTCFPWLSSRNFPVVVFAKEESAARRIHLR